MEAKADDDSASGGAEEVSFSARSMKARAKLARRVLGVGDPSIQKEEWNRREQRVKRAAFDCGSIGSNQGILEIFASDANLTAQIRAVGITTFPAVDVEGEHNWKLDLLHPLTNLYALF